MKIVGVAGLGGLWELEFDSFRDIRVHAYDFLKFVGGLWA